MTVAVRLQPNARQSQIDGPARLNDGTAILRVRVSEPPEKGKANAALIKLLSKTWRLPKTSIEVQSGQSDRHKTLLVIGGKERFDALSTWLGELESDQKAGGHGT